MVIPAEVRAELVAHAEAEAPNEACGLIVFEDGVATRYEPGVNTEASPFRFNIRFADPATPFLADEEGVEIGIFHSHLSSAPRPSKTDVENIDGYEGWPYLIYSVRFRDLAAFRIHGRGQIEEIPLD